MTWRTALRMSGIHLPLGSFIGIQETFEEIDEVVLERDLCGAVVALGPLWGPKYRIVLRASGAAIRFAPAFGKLRKGVDVVTLDCTTHLTDHLPPGISSTVLVRTPVPGSVYVHYSDDERSRIPFTLVGDTVTLAPGFDAARAHDIKLKPRLQAVLRDRSTDTPEIAGTMGWAASLEEI